MKKIFTLFAAMLLALTASAETWNITPERADTLKATIGRANNGDTILLAKGSASYTESATDIYKNLTIKAADMKNQPTVKAVALGISGDAAGVRVKFEGIKFDAQSVGEHLLFSYDATNSGNKLILEGCEFYGFTLNSSLINCGSGYKLDSLVVNNCYFHNIKKSCIFLENADMVGLKVTNSTFANITTDKTSYYAAPIQSKGTSVRIDVDNCTFYNVQTMSTDYGAVGYQSDPTSNYLVQNCIFALPSDQNDIRAIYLQVSGGYVKNCLTHHYTKSDSYPGIHSGPTISGCSNLKNVDPQFADAANNNFTPNEETSPAKGAGVGGTHLGDPNNWPASWQPAEVIPVTSIALDHDALTLDVNETAFLHATVLPVNATDPSVTWTSKNNAIATVVNGAVKGIAAGEVMIIAKAGDKADTCTVTVSDAIPDFASPYFFMGTKAQLAGYISVNEADSLHYNDRSNPGTATWKINVTDPCFINATANFKTGSASGAKLRVVILDSEDAQVGDSLMQDYHEEDGDLAFTGSIVLPKAGIYTVKLVNIEPWSSAKLRGITLTKDASKDVVFKGAWDEWTLHPATSIAADGSSASVKVVLPAGDYDFGVTLGDEFRANGWWLKPEGPMTATNITGNTGNMKVCPALNLEHTFTWTYATNAVTVTFPEVTVYFVNESDWAVVNAYAWREARTDNPKIENADWPGIALEPTGEKSEGKDIYSYTFSAYKNIIFNDGSSQTANLAVDPAKPYYYAGDWHETLPGEPTAIDNTVVGEKAMKLMENGQIVIIKNGVRYNVLGTVVR